MATAIWPLENGQKTINKKHPNRFRTFRLFSLVLDRFCTFSLVFSRFLLGVSQRPLTLILLQKYRDTNWRRIAIQIGGAYTTFCQAEGILLQEHRDRNGRCITILFKSIGVRGRFDSPDFGLSGSDLFGRPFP